MPANQAGKGPQPRAYDTTKFASGMDRIYGSKKPWWEVRDESTQMGTKPREGSAGAPMNWFPPPEQPEDDDVEDVVVVEQTVPFTLGHNKKPEPFTPYQVPLIQDPTFGPYLKLPMPFEDDLVIVLHRHSHGWKTPEHYHHVRLPHQIHTKDLPVDESHEIVVVGLNTGTWVTVWASAPGEITHPKEAVA